MDEFISLAGLHLESLLRIGAIADSIASFAVLQVLFLP